MSRSPIQNIKLNEHLTLSECHPDSECRKVNWWLYDTRLGWNIGMREESKEAALLEGLELWAEKALKYESELKALQAKVNSFLSQFPEEDDY